MAFTPEQVEDFIAALQDDPRLRDRVRDAILADDFLALPGIVRSIGDRLDRLTERFDQLTERVDQLTERVDQLTERVDRLTERFDQLTERVDQLTERVDRLTERFDQLTQRVDRLAERVDGLAQEVSGLSLQVSRLVSHAQDADGRSGNLEGWRFQSTYEQHLGAWLGKWYRLVQTAVLADDRIVSDAYDSGRLSESEWDHLMALDIVAKGVRRGDPEARQLYVILELSLTVDANDVSRVHARAEILRRLGLEVDACVDGEAIQPDVRTLAEQVGVHALVAREAAA
jgi:uncharacterized protein YoxC